MIPFDRCLSGRIHDKHSCFKGQVESQEVGSSGKLPRLWEEDDTGNRYMATDGLLLSSEYRQVGQEPLKGFCTLDAMFLDSATPFQSYEHQIQNFADIESQYSELINPGMHLKRTGTQGRDAVCYETSGHKLSTDAIIRLGGERFIQSCSPLMNNIMMPAHPYISSFSGHTEQEAKDIELIEYLLLSAEKVSQQQFERASKLLDWCDVFSSSLGNPIQRLVHYFSKALRNKIASETGRMLFLTSEKKQIHDLGWKLMSPNPTVISIGQKLPFIQAGLFSGVQALVDGVAEARKVHIIDLSVKNGVQVIILMQALISQANCPVEHLKVTAVGTMFKEKIEQTGNQLKSFAESINLSFSFNVVMVGDMLDFKEDLIELDPDEALAIYSSHGLWSMLAQQDRLESLMKVIRNMNPNVMVVSEVAVNLNSPNFVNRFIEALFFYGAFFDSLEDCMDREDQTRTITESMYSGIGIQSIVGAEGAERVVRHVNIDVWRKFFTRYGMTEVELSMSSLYQAKLLVENFPCGHHCTFGMNGACLIIGWKGTPMQYVSSWKFL